MSRKIHIWIKEQLFRALLASLLESRTVTFSLIGIAVLQLGFVAIGWNVWQCPIKAVLGIPCPGCGLSTALLLLIQGKWTEALSTHAFAPVFFVAFILMAVISLLPGQLRQGVISRLALLEQRTGIVMFALLGLIVYWGLRLFGMV